MSFSKLEDIFGSYDKAVSVLRFGAQMVSRVEGLIMSAWNLVNKGFTIAKKDFSVAGGSIATMVGIVAIPFRKGAIPDRKQVEITSK